MRRFDVLIVGAGPAGSSLALRLARRGVSVGLLDARAFPRSKPCGDAISPGATPLLEELGVWDTLRDRANGAMLRGWRLRAPNGLWAEGNYELARHERDTPDRGLAIDRRRLDATLFDAAVAAGAAPFERRRVFAIEGTHDGASAPWRVSARSGDGTERFEARVLVGADGLRSRVARAFGRVRRGPRPRIALVGRFAGGPAPAPWGELRLSAEGVLGYAPTGPDRCNVTVVMPATYATAIRPDPERLLRDRVERYGAAARLVGARLERAIEVTGPFELTPTRRTTGAGEPPGLLVGDAAGYFDPLTGQGVYRGLFGARLAATAVESALEHPQRAAAALGSYETALERELAPTRRLQRLIDAVVTRPRLMNPAARLLRRRPTLANRLIDAAGDRLAPAEVFAMGAWIQTAIRSQTPAVREEHDAYA